MAAHSVSINNKKRSSGVWVTFREKPDSRQSFSQSPVTLEPEEFNNLVDVWYAIESIVHSHQVTDSSADLYYPLKHFAHRLTEVMSEVSARVPSQKS